MKTILLLALLGGACGAAPPPTAYRILPEALCVELPDAQWPALDYHASGAWVYMGEIIGYSADEHAECIEPPS